MCFGQVVDGSIECVPLDGQTEQAEALRTQKPFILANSRFLYPPAHACYARPGFPRLRNTFFSTSKRRGSWSKLLYPHPIARPLHPLCLTMPTFEILLELSTLPEDTILSREHISKSTAPRSVRWSGILSPCFPSPVRGPGQAFTPRL